MQIEHASPVPAAQELLAFIREKYGDIPSFCESKGLDRLKVQRAIRGDMLRVDVDFAFAIEEATDGAVKAEGWRVDDELKAELKRRRAAADAAKEPAA